MKILQKIQEIISIIFRKELVIGVDIDSIYIFGQNSRFNFTINVLADKIDETTFKLPDEFNNRGYFLNDPKEVVKVVNFEGELYAVPSKPLKYDHKGMRDLYEEIKKLGQ